MVTIFLNFVIDLLKSEAFELSFEKLVSLKFPAESFFTVALKLFTKLRKAFVILRFLAFFRNLKEP